MTNEIYYAIKVMVYRGSESKVMFFNFETENLLDEWMGACTQGYTPQELHFLINSLSFNWEKALIKQWGSLLPDLSFSDWGVMKIQAEFQTV